MGNTISDLSIDVSTGGANVGLFGEYNGQVDKEIRDIGLQSVSIIGSGSTQNVGGIVGYQALGNIVNCSVTGQVSSTGPSSSAGGLAVGTVSFAAIDGSWSTAAVAATGPGSMAGGLVGSDVNGTAGAPVSESYASGSVAVSDSGIAGGLVGQNLGAIIDNSYADGPVTGGANAIYGGLVGTNANDPHVSSPATITRSYSAGAVSAGSEAVIGGLTGADSSGTLTAAAYWHLDASGASTPNPGAGNISNDPGFTGLSTARQFQLSGLSGGFQIVGLGAEADAQQRISLLNCPSSALKAGA